jgi:putative transposase
MNSWVTAFAASELSCTLLYREEGLAVRRRRGRRRAVGMRAPIVLPQASNQRWSLDFIADQIADGRRFRVLAVVDDFTRECLTTVVDTSRSGERVVGELDRLIIERGRPLVIVSDNGTELTSRVVLRWAALSTGATSSLASRSRMPSSKASTAACAMSVSTSAGSRAALTLGARLKPGASITTPFGHTAVSTICRRRCLPRSPLP